jgi:hypothetical protein
MQAEWTGANTKYSQIAYRMFQIVTGYGRVLKAIAMSLVQLGE